MREKARLLNKEETGFFNGHSLACDLLHGFFSQQIPDCLFRW